MLSGYFKIKTKTKVFHQRIESIINRLKEKQVLVYGADSAFVELNKQYDFNNKLNIIAITDKKFENGNCKKFCNIKAIKPKDIANEEFDAIIVMSENYEPVIEYIQRVSKTKNNDIITIFEQRIPDEIDNLNYLYNLNFEKKLDKLAKKLKSKKVVLYGAGAYFRLIFEYFDMSKFNITAISDHRFQWTGEQNFYGYKTCTPHDIESLKPDYVLISTKYYVDVFENLHQNLLKNTGIKILPLIDKSLFTLIKETYFQQDLHNSL